MPRTFLIFEDIEGNLDVLRVECTKCARKGRYSVHKLIEGAAESRNWPSVQGWANKKHITFSPPLWRPTELVTARFGPAPSSCDRIDNHSVRVGTRAVAIARTAIRGWCGDRRSGAVGRRRSRGAGRVGRGRPPDICRPSSSADGSSSNSSSYCRAAVCAPMYSPANPSNARCRKRPSDPGFSGVQREFSRCHIKRGRHRRADQSGTNAGE
jgi:hypothetical protein